MILNDEQHLLYMEPKSPASGVAVIDDYTRLMAGTFGMARETGVCFRGFHLCRCGVASTNTDYVLPGGLITNSLCVHYLAYHRHEVPEHELARVLAFGQQSVIPLEPNEHTLAPPRRTSIVDPGRTGNRPFYEPKIEQEPQRTPRYVGLRER